MPTTFDPPVTVTLTLRYVTLTLRYVTNLSCERDAHRGGPNSTVNTEYHVFAFQYNAYVVQCKRERDTREQSDLWQFRWARLGLRDMAPPPNFWGWRTGLRFQGGVCTDKSCLHTRNRSESQKMRGELHH